MCVPHGVLSSWRGLEHPRDPGKDPYPSFFHSSAADLLRAQGMTDVVFDQCRFKAAAKKPTQMLLNRDDHLQSLQNHFCNHQWHEPHIGLGTTGQFKTFPLAQYPKEFCSRLADLAWNYTPYSVCSAGHGAWEDFYQAAAFPFEHPAKQVATAIHQCTQPFQR